MAQVNNDVKVRVRATQAQAQGQVQRSSQTGNVPMVSEDALAQDQYMGLDLEITTSQPAPKPAQKPVKRASAKPAQTTVNNTNTNSGNNIGTVGGENHGNVIIGGGNAVGGDGSVNNSGSNNTVIQNKGQQKPEPTPKPTPTPDPTPVKPTIPKSDKQRGEDLANQLHAETDSSWANNGNVAYVFGRVNENNAYTFFKKYQNLADGDKNKATTGAMHDTYDISDTFNTINIKTTGPAIQALLEQAESIGLGGSEEFETLSTLASLADGKNSGLGAAIRTPDLSNGEAKDMDAAIKALVAKMDEIYQ